MKRQLYFGLLTSLLFASCVTAPSTSVRTRYAVISAESEDEDEAQTIANLVDELVPAIESTLPATDSSEFSVWLLDIEQIHSLPGPDDAVAKADPEHRRIFLSTKDSRPAGSEWAQLGWNQTDAQAADLAHELVHVMLTDEWRTLPPRIEEGLADRVACELIKSSGRELRLSRILGAYNLNGEDLQLRMKILDSRYESVGPVTFTLLARISAAFPNEEQQRTYSSGFVIASSIVNRMGFEGMHQLCLLAGKNGLEVIPTDWLSKAAGFDIEDPLEMRKAAARELTDGDIIWLAEKAYENDRPAAEDRGRLLSVRIPERETVELVPHP